MKTGYFFLESLLLFELIGQGRELGWKLLLRYECNTPYYNNPRSWRMRPLGILVFCLVYPICAGKRTLAGI